MSRSTVLPLLLHAARRATVSPLTGARCLTLVLTILSVTISKPAVAAPPRYDHVVIVIEENRTPAEIIGDLVNAPYLNQLANAGVRFAAMFAIEHPSQPNYLQLFSGSNQGVVDDELPPNFATTPTSTYPFRTPNLGASLVAAGFTFAGYSEQLEAAGNTDWADYDPHSDTHPGVHYRRKHNPWANWVAKVSPLPANQLTGTVNRAFTQFPSDYAALPNLCFVIPNQLHDMHDGSRRQGDDWLRDNLSGYAAWARTNNSLLIVTWDEDDYNLDNRIPTIFHGAGLRQGSVIAGTWTLHNLLRTLEDMYGLTNHAGSAAQVRSIVGPFLSDPPALVATFRQGLNGYNSARDTHLSMANPDTSYATSQDLIADLDTSSSSGSQPSQVLVRFNNLFGFGTNQVPAHAAIHSAKLLLHTPRNPSGADFDSDDTFRLHRMIADWTDSATWNSLDGGVSADGIEAAAAATFSAVPDVDGGPAIFDVTSDIEMFMAGTPNRGWLVRPSSGGVGDGWTMKSSEALSDATLRPTLEIVYTPPPTPYYDWAAARGLIGANQSPQANPDLDSANNLTEFAYNMNPLAADARAVTPGGTSGLPAARHLPEAPGGRLEVEFLRRKGLAGAGLTYAIEFSTDLNTWAPGPAPVVTEIDADWERVVARDAIGGSNAGRFARIVVTLQP